MLSYGADLRKVSEPRVYLFPVGNMFQYVANPPRCSDRYRVAGIKLGVVEVELGQTDELASQFCRVCFALFPNKFNGTGDVGAGINLEVRDCALEVDYPRLFIE